jgi:hypothetical protein
MLAGYYRTNIYSPGLVERDSENELRVRNGRSSGSHRKQSQEHT